jgi:hypothetical protein
VLADELEHLLFVGEFPGFELRVDEVPVERQLEAAATAGDQLQLVDFLLVRGQQLGRQTDGLRLVVSHRAVFEFHFHLRIPPGWVVARGDPL